jgi:hypothetical protein
VSVGGLDDVAGCEGDADVDDAEVDDADVDDADAGSWSSAVEHPAARPAPTSRTSVQRGSLLCTMTSW